MEDRRKEHECIHEGDLAVLMTWMADTKQLLGKIRDVFIQNMIQLIATVAILIVVVYKMFAK